MPEYKDMTCTEGMAAITAALGRLTVLRGLLDTPPLRALLALLDVLERGELGRAAECYHALAAALLVPGSRRVSGDLFLDFLLAEILEQPNAFSLSAARGVWEEPLAAAMRSDLTRLGELAGLNSVTLKRWAGERLRECRARPRRNQDAISTLSSAVWAGGASRPLPPPNTEAPAAPALPARLDEHEWLSWRYAVDGLPDEYVADAALEEMYRRLMHTGDWGLLLDDIWSFHNTCGVGAAMLRSRVFQLLPDGTLAGLPTSVLPPEDDLTLYGPEREAILQSVIRFMQGEARAQNLLVTGAAGTGKTTQALSVARELPEVRLILCEGAPPEAVGALLPMLCAQPLRFLLFVDDVDFAHPAYPALRAALRRCGAQPENVMLLAAAREGADTLFPLTVSLREPPLKEFIELVRQLLLREGRDVEYDSLQNACIDCAAAGGGLSFPAAYAIAERFLLAGGA